MSEIYYNASNLIVGNGFVRNPERYYLEEFFLQRPALNGVLDSGKGGTSDSTTTAAELTDIIKANKNFEVFGENMTSDLCTFNSKRAAITITTAGADQDQAIILPHLDSKQTAWTEITWGTQNQVEWECAISIPNIEHIKVWAGLKLTKDQLFKTDDNQAFFKFQTDSTNSEEFTTFANLHFIYSKAGTDYITDLGIPVSADTIYRLRIVINKAREVTIFVNEKQYSLTHTSPVGGATESAVNKRSLALTNDKDLIPYIGVEAGIGIAKSLDVYYQKISRALFE